MAMRNYENKGNDSSYVGFLFKIHNQK